MRVGRVSLLLAVVLAFVSWQLAYSIPEYPACNAWSWKYPTCGDAPKCWWTGIEFATRKQGPLPGCSFWQPSGNVNFIACGSGHRCYSTTLLRGCCWNGTVSIVIGPSVSICLHHAGKAPLWTQLQADAKVNQTQNNQLYNLSKPSGANACGKCKYTQNGDPTTPIKHRFTVNVTCENGSSVSDVYKREVNCIGLITEG